MDGWASGKRYRELAEDDFWQFSFIKSSVLAPWFYVDAYVIDDDGRWGKQFMIPSWDALRDFLGNEENSVVILDLYYVTPPTTNGTRSWKMEKVECINVEEGIDGLPVPIYKVVTERIYAAPQEIESEHARSALYEKRRSSHDRFGSID